jgi:hypothetical protein
VDHFRHKFVGDRILNVISPWADNPQLVVRQSLSEPTGFKALFLNVITILNEARYRLSKPTECKEVLK